MIQIQKQTWTKLTRYILFAEGGSAQLEIFPAPLGDQNVQAYISRLWVEPEYRRKGIAKALLDAAEELARQEGKDAVFLEWDMNDAVWPEENHARKIFDHYISRGYVEVEFGRDSALMKLTLGEATPKNML